MTVQNTEFDDIGQKPQTFYYEQDTAISGTSDVINFDFNLKPGYYTFSSFTGGSVMYFNPNWSTSVSMGTASLFQTTSTLPTAYLPLSAQWGVVAGTFNNPSSPAGIVFQSYNENRYLVVARNGGLYESSNNGTTWTSYSSTMGQPDDHSFVYVGGLYIHSNPGANRTSTTTTPSNSASWSTRITYGFGSMNVWSAVNPRILGSSTYNWMATSQDGFTWTTRPRPTSTNRWVKQVGNYNYLFSDPARLYYTSDNINWTQANIPSSPQGTLTGLTYGNGVYIATGQYWATGSYQFNGVYYSTNGTTFSTAGLSGGVAGLKLGNGDYCWPIEYSTTGGRFVVFTTSQSFSSTDGLNWIKHSTSNGSGMEVSQMGSYASGAAANNATFIGTDGKVLYTISSGQTMVTYRSFSNSGTVVWNSSQSLAKGSITYWGDVDSSKFRGKSMY